MDTTGNVPHSAVQELEAAMRAAGESGPILGHFGSVSVAGGGFHSWVSIRYNEAVPKLLATPEYRVAQILSALGNEVRLAMLRLLLTAPRTAAELVAELGLGTTGQAYHHLRELERAGYTYQRGGRYHFDLKVGRVYLTALNLAADAGAEQPEEQGG